MTFALTFAVIGQACFFDPSTDVQSVFNVVPKYDLKQCEVVPRREDYTYKPYLGAYKVHTKSLIWNDARLACNQEDAELLILTSSEEAAAVSEIFQLARPHTDPPYSNYSLVGMTNYYDTEDWVTIRGQSISQAGYDIWAPKQPDNKNNQEHCGSIFRDGKLNDIDCDRPYSFICKLNHPWVKPVE